ncbi:MAG: TerB family tellurite resistance protein [Deltaproteobacteria bacterium]|nr:TerB family tellurite resistance protein [Deltaproteobacteria bacterium]
MMDLFPEIEIQKDQAEAIARGLYAVARADGSIHEREAALISEFFSSTVERASDLGALERAPAIEPATLALLLPSPELRRLFIKTAFLLAYVDNAYGGGEAGVIGEFAKALAIGEAELSRMEVQVKEYLLSQLSHLSNIEAAAQVAKEIKV